MHQMQVAGPGRASRSHMLHNQRFSNASHMSHATTSSDVSGPFRSQRPSFNGVHAQHSGGDACPTGPLTRRNSAASSSLRETPLLVPPGSEGNSLLDIKAKLQSNFKQVEDLVHEVDRLQGEDTGANTNGCTRS